MVSQGDVDGHLSPGGELDEVSGIQLHIRDNWGAREKGTLGPRWPAQSEFLGLV